MPALNHTGSARCSRRRQRRRSSISVEQQRRKHHRQEKRASRVGRRQWAPEHFAFWNARRELYTLPVWEYRRLIILVSGVFVLKGGHNVLWELDRTKWTFPIQNARWLLIAHWICSTPFLLGVLIQRWQVPEMADAGRQNPPLQAHRIRQRHRWIGKFTLGCSLLASMTALALAPRALAGNWVFAIWSILWLVNTILVYRSAQQRRWHTHKLWAENLSRNAIAFVFGRFLLALYAHGVWYILPSSSSSSSDRHGGQEEDNVLLLVESHKAWVTPAYYWAVVGTLIFTLINTAQCAKVHSASEHKAMAQLRWRKVRYAVFLLILHQSVRRQHQKKKGALL